jgi:GNAT superfamily N-acetyltransferase
MARLGAGDAGTLFFQIGMALRWRRQGIGRRLLARVARHASHGNRTLLITATSERVPAGAAFMLRLGGTPGQVSEVGELELARLDRTRLREWRERAGERAAGFELDRWRGPYPETALVELAAVKQAINLAPRDRLQLEEWRWTPELLREMDAALAARGIERRTLAARDPQAGTLAGYTETLWSAERPELLQQGDTAVLPAYRNRGLGRWLKAAMLEWVLREQPQVTCVRTAYASSNAAMRRINDELGFRRVQSWTLWQVERAQVDAYLGQRSY